MTGMTFRLGLIINPLAGIGGSVALKGSDGAETVKRAMALGAQPKAGSRALVALRVINNLQDQLQLITYPGEMGESIAIDAGFSPQVIGHIEAGDTTPADTEEAALAMIEHGIDLLLFAGGDGTARNICNAVGDQVPVLGIPAGVKIHSGVYAVTPVAAGEMVRMLVQGGMVSISEAEVRDIDEIAFRDGVVKAKYYGELRVPVEGGFVQQVKSGGCEVEELVLQDIAAFVVEHMEEDVFYLMGSGTTVASVMEEMELDNTLLGVDVIKNQELIASDVTEQQILELIKNEPTKIIVTIIGGQGHILGRGNQQLSPAVIRTVGKSNLIIVATKTKLSELEGRPLLVDSGDEALNQELRGFKEVITGYNDNAMYPVQ